MIRAIRALAFIVIMAGVAGVAQQPAPAAPKEAQQQLSDVTEVSADLGSCSVEFRATDMRGKPLYNVKIRTQIRYGFLGKRKLDLEAGTNSDGRARFVNMPEQVKTPLMFEAHWGSDKASIAWDPGNNCHAQYPMLLGQKADKE